MTAQGQGGAYVRHILDFDAVKNRPDFHHGGRVTASDIQHPIVAYQVHRIHSHP